MANKVKVYFVKLNELEKIKSILPSFEGKLGLKCHFGEAGNDAFVSADYIKEISKMVEHPNLLETTVLYRGVRSKASTHKELALEHGFDFAEIDILDGEEGDDNIEIETASELEDGKMRKYYLGKNLEKYKSLLVVSHFKGHIAAGFGGAIKNLSMGLASRRGKLDMHAGGKHQVTEGAWISCGMCIQSCPVEAISFAETGKAFIDQEKCISCSKCIAVCPPSAIHIPWGTTVEDDFKNLLSEYAQAAIKDKQCFFINFVINIVPQCDCMGIAQEKMCDDIGVLVSSDPVAIDQASFDLVIKDCPNFKEHNGEKSLEHGEKIGLGTRDYEMIDL